MKLTCLFDSVYSPFIIFLLVYIIFSETLENISPTKEEQKENTHYQVGKSISFYILWHIFTIFTILTLARLGRLCFEKLRFFLNAFSECRKYYFRDPNFKNFLGGMPLDPPSYLVPTVLGDRILSWEEGARKMGLLAVLPHHWKILKKCTAWWRH
jgi:hypothetical protein